MAIGLASVFGWRAADNREAPQPGDGEHPDAAEFGLQESIDETKHNSSTNALIRRWRTLKRGTT
jgi:hypothetical protein